jgi:hypothetical protein
MGGASKKYFEYDSRRNVGIVSILLLLAVGEVRFVGTGRTTAAPDCCCLDVELAEFVEKEDLCEDEDGSALLTVLRQVAVVPEMEVLWQSL